MTGSNPTAVEGLHYNEVDDGLVVYDSSADRVHYLNHTAAFVFRLCDGTRATSDLAALMATAFRLEEPPVQEASACLRKLRDEGLVR